MTPLVGLAALLALPPITALAYKEGPLPAMTGGFGEKDCHTCHFDNPINDHAGVLRLEGVPARYVPGHQYEITVVVRRSGIKRAGFELAARFAEGAGRGRQAGTLGPTDVRTQMTSGTGRIGAVHSAQQGGIGPGRTGRGPMARVVDRARAGRRARDLSRRRQRRE